MAALAVEQVRAPGSTAARTAPCLATCLAACAASTQSRAALLASAARLAMAGG
jgi:hypothetical protein